MISREYYVAQELVSLRKIRKAGRHNAPLRPFTDVCYRPTVVVHADSDWGQELPSSAD